jgi:hypothetical protein
MFDSSIRASTTMPSQHAITLIEALKSYVDEREGRRERVEWALAL